MSHAAAVRWVLPVTCFVCLLVRGALAGDDPAAQPQPSEVPADVSARRGTEPRDGQRRLEGLGFLIADPRDSQGLIKDRIRALFSFDGSEPERSRADTSETLDALLASDRTLPGGSPEVLFEFHAVDSIDGFRRNLLNSTLFRQSEQVCPQDCPFRDLDEDSLHIHLTKPAGGPGDSVLVLTLREFIASQRPDHLANALSSSPEWLKEAYVDGVRPAGVKVFGLRVTLTDSER